MVLWCCDVVRLGRWCGLRCVMCWLGLGSGLCLGCVCCGVVWLVFGLVCVGWLVVVVDISWALVGLFTR